MGKMRIVLTIWVEEKFKQTIWDKLLATMKRLLDKEVILAYGLEAEPIKREES